MVGKGCFSEKIVCFIGTRLPELTQYNLPEKNQIKLSRTNQQKLSKTEQPKSINQDKGPAFLDRPLDYPINFSLSYFPFDFERNK